jgi:hypothetical protein
MVEMAKHNPWRDLSVTNINRAISSKLDLAMRLMEERDEQLLAMAICISGQLAAVSAEGTDKPEGSVQTAWRLAQVLEAELSSVKYRSEIYGLLK